jgi:hypothetical protein
MTNLIITPKTRIYELLEAYPDLEETLIAAAPEFRKLKNPLLRRTIARITNIGQAAVVGGLNVEELVNRLREKAGQDKLDQLADEGNRYITVCPDWYNATAVVETIDIRDMLHRGEQPVYEVLAAIKRLGSKEILEILAPFIPAPLLDKSLSLGYRHWLVKASDDQYKVYFTL